NNRLDTNETWTYACTSLGVTQSVTNTATASGHFVTPTANVTVTDDDTVTVVGNPPPTCSVVPPTSCIGNQILVATGQGGSGSGYTFHWTKNGISIPGGENGILQANGTGTYCAFVSDGALCSSQTPCCAEVNQGPHVTVLGANVCVGVERGQLCATVTGGTPPYELSWYREGFPELILETCTVQNDGGMCCVNLPAGSEPGFITY